MLAGRCFLIIYHRHFTGPTPVARNSIALAVNESSWIYLASITSGIYWTRVHHFLRLSPQGADLSGMVVLGATETSRLHLLYSQVHRQALGQRARKQGRESKVVVSAGHVLYGWPTYCGHSPWQWALGPQKSYRLRALISDLRPVPCSFHSILLLSSVEIHLTYLSLLNFICGRRNF